jgi:hypothetical protein
VYVAGVGYLSVLIARDVTICEYGCTIVRGEPYIECFHNDGLSLPYRTCLSDSPRNVEYRPYLEG